MKTEKNTKKTKVSEAVLVNQFVQNPSHENFNLLWERYYYGLKKYAYGFLKDEDMSKEAVIESFTNAWNKKETFDPERGAFSTWIYRICRNVCLGYRKQREKDNYIDYDISDCYDSIMKQGNEHLLEMPDNQYMVNDNNELEHLSNKDIVQHMYDASVNEINNLENSMMRNILIDKLINNKKLREIAEENNTHISNIKNKLYTGKQIIFTNIKNKYPELFEMYSTLSSGNPIYEM